MVHPSKRKGNTFEREIVHLLQEAGITAHRVPLSGAVQGYEGDLRVAVGGLERRAECKRRRRGFSTLYSMLGVNDLLFVRDNRTQPMAVMPLREFCALAQELNYYKELYLGNPNHALDMEHGARGRTDGAVATGVKRD